MGYVTIQTYDQVFKCAIAGAIHPNSDGSSRQDAIAKLLPGERLALVRDPDNPFDKHAIAVFNSKNQQIGFMPGGDIRLARHLDQGSPAYAEVVEVIGKPTFFQRITGSNKGNLGCIIAVHKQDPDWKAIEGFTVQNRAIDELVKTANQHEKENPERAIELYRAAIDALILMDSGGSQHKAWRTVKYPINRLSLLLDKTGRKSEALNEIKAWEAYNDHEGISETERESVVKRKIRLLK